MILRMPKTNEKDAYYFPHDCNARNDPKILALRSVFGAEGYGVYWMLIEIRREQPDYKLQVTKYLYHAMDIMPHLEISCRSMVFCAIESKSLYQKEEYFHISLSGISPLRILR